MFMLTDCGKEWSSPDGRAVTHHFDEKGERCTIRGFDNDDLEWMQYHSSWDWLMPALKKYNKMYNINLLYCKNPFNICQCFKSLGSQLKLRNNKN